MAYYNYRYIRNMEYYSVVVPAPGVCKTRLWAREMITLSNLSRLRLQKVSKAWAMRAARSVVEKHSLLQRVVSREYVAAA